MTKLEAFQQHFGERLSKILKEKRMTQSELGSAIGKDKSIISKYISGDDRVPRVETLLAICDALNISTDYFLNENISDLEPNKIPCSYDDVLKSLIILIRTGYIKKGYDEYDPTNESFYIADTPVVNTFLKAVYNFNAFEGNNMDHIILALVDEFKDKLENECNKYNNLVDITDKDLPF